VSADLPGVGRKLKYDPDMTEATPAGVRRALAALELAAVRHRSGVRRQLGVGDDELSALLYLAREGAAPQGRLAELTTLSRSGAGALVQRLEHRGLVRRRSDPHDRRRRLVELSPAGRERMRDAYAELDAAADGVLAERPEAELAALLRLLDALRRAAEAATGPAEAVPAAATGEPIWRRWG
jgi:DNA-binding MarR family transcriptional regulator